MPETAHRMFESVGYCFSLGFQGVAPVPVFEADWEEKHWDILDGQMGLITKWFLYNYKLGARPHVKFLSDSLRKPGKPRRHFCGAARNMVAVDPLGRITPCHRFSATHKEDWLCGNVMDEEWDFNSYQEFLTDVSELGCSCEAEALCNRGCPSVNFETSGSILQNEPNHCRFTQLAWKHAKVVRQELSLEAA